MNGETSGAGVFARARISGQERVENLAQGRITHEGHANAE
jgi:hypothetical protein